MKMLCGRGVPKSLLPAGGVLTAGESDGSGGHEMRSDEVLRVRRAKQNGQEIHICVDFVYNDKQSHSGEALKTMSRLFVYRIRSVYTLIPLCIFL